MTKKELKQRLPKLKEKELEGLVKLYEDTKQEDRLALVQSEQGRR